MSLFVQVKGGPQALWTLNLVTYFAYRRCSIHIGCHRREGELSLIPMVEFGSLVTPPRSKEFLEIVVPIGYMALL